MSDDAPKWSRMMAPGGAIGGMIIGYTVLGALFQQTDANAGEAAGRAMAATILGVLIGSPAGASIAFGVGKLMEKLNVKF
jgi:hypothetical protein